MDTNTPVAKNNLAIPLAIVLAGALIAGAIFITNKKDMASEALVQKADVEVRPIDSKDHILGNPKAEILLVEYSDFQCPYCQQFHESMKKIMSEYGEDGKVAWVYRHYWAERKLQDGRIFHPQGGVAAEASECVAELGGNDKFWAFAHGMFQSQTTQQTYINDLVGLATSIGIDKQAFETCATSRKHKEFVQSEYDAARKIGVSGTPTSFLVSKAGIFPVEGTVPYEQLKQIVEQVLDLN